MGTGASEMEEEWDDEQEERKKYARKKARDFAISQDPTIKEGVRRRTESERKREEAQQRKVVEQRKKNWDEFAQFGYGFGNRIKMYNRPKSKIQTIYRGPRGESLYPELGETGICPPGWITESHLMIAFIKDTFFVEYAPGRFRYEPASHKIDLEKMSRLRLAFTTPDLPIVFVYTHEETGRKIKVPERYDMLVYEDYPKIFPEYKGFTQEKTIPPKSDEPNEFIFVNPKTGGVLEGLTPGLDLFHEPPGYIRNLVSGGGNIKSARK